MQHKTSLPLPVLIIGGAVAGYIVAWLLTTVLSTIAIPAGVILGALWGLSLYRKTPR